MNEKFLQMKPGRDLDIAVALEVMGFIWLKHLLQFSAELAVKWLGTPADIEQSGGVYTALTKESEMVSLKLRENFDEAVPAFSTEMGSAQKVIEHMNSIGYIYNLEKEIVEGESVYYASFKKDGIQSETAPPGFATELEAIAKAALVAVLSDREK